MDEKKATTRNVSSRRKLTELLDPQFMARLDSLDVLSRKILQGKLQGERRSKRRGQSVEFADHRPYVAGDDLRFVDWNIYGRLNQLFLKLFLEEQDLTVHIVLDDSASMNDDRTISNKKTNSTSATQITKSGFAKRLAAALGYVSLVNNNRVTLSSFSHEITGQLAHMRGRNYLPQMAEFLLRETPQESPLSPDDPDILLAGFDGICRQLSAGRTGTGIMIIISDFFFKQGYQSGLRRLIGGKYDIYTIQVLSLAELEPEFTGDLKLVDIEDSDTAEITISTALLKYYKRTLNSYCNELKDFCTSRGGVYVLARSNDSIESLVLKYLLKIGLLR